MHGNSFWAHLCVCTMGSYASPSVCLWSLDQNHRLVKKSYLAKYESNSMMRIGNCNSEVKFWSKINKSCHLHVCSLQCHVAFLLMGFVDHDQVIIEMYNFLCPIPENDTCSNNCNGELCTVFCLLRVIPIKRTELVSHTCTPTGWVVYRSRLSFSILRMPLWANCWSQ